MSTLLRQTRRLTLGVTLLIGAASAWGYTEGEGAPEGSLHQYNINLNHLSIEDNVAGGMVDDSWNLGGNYAVRFYCTSSIPVSPIYYTVTSTMSPSSQGNKDYLKLNDYMDVKVEVYIAGQRKQYVVAPFTNESNRYNYVGCRPPYKLVSNVKSGSQGKVTFMVTKPIVNGLNLTSQDLVKVMGRLGNMGGVPATPISQVAITSGIITVPDKCVINQGKTIEVEFGDIPGSAEKLTGDNYVKSVPVHVECKGGSFETGALNIRMGIQPNGVGVASFNSDYLGTSGAVDRSNLGIVLKDESGAIVQPNKFYEIPGFNNNKGDWNLTAAPVAKPGSTVIEGEFESSATVVAEFQ
ncbi:fimbrial protein [Enterobacteriaceae bacterium BIT-l23]|uniref:fimbrial protein n=1 Tax=Jejubacter sp. L23 TaxID=3092086 RepID=UPI0015847B18|nr:fimbrial protein [Enterobacteriaceae bacterium BIT-l23]